MWECISPVSIRRSKAKAKRHLDRTSHGQLSRIEMYMVCLQWQWCTLVWHQLGLPSDRVRWLDGSRDSRPGASAVHPLPSESFFDGQSLSSYFAHAFRSSIAAMTGRPRSLVTWSGVPPMRCKPGLNAISLCLAAIVVGSYATRSANLALLEKATPSSTGARPEHCDRCLGSNRRR